MSTLRITDPCSDIILDFIAGGVPGNPSGESDGNYDAVIGNAHSTHDLSVMTIQQVYALQAQLLAKGEPSSAVGRYQDIRATLASLVNAEHLPATTIFTQELQDRLAVDLLNSACFYKGWRAGTVSDPTFAHLIACQWASLPDPRNGGKSRYDGVGPNHSGTSLTAVYAMLQRARAALHAAPAALPTSSAIQAPLSVAKPSPVRVKPAAPAPVSIKPAAVDKPVAQQNPKSSAVRQQPAPKPAPAAARPWSFPGASYYDSDAEAEALNRQELGE